MVKSYASTLTVVLSIGMMLRLVAGLLVIMTILEIAVLLLGRSLSSGELAFISNRDGDAEVFTLDIDRNILHNLTHNQAWERDFIWSPDGEHLAFYSNQSREWEVYTIDASGGSLQQITNNRLFETNLVWFVGSDEIAFTVPRIGGNTLFIVDTKGGSLNQPREYIGAINPTWSPDGRQIAYFQYYNRALALYIADQEGENPQRIATGIKAQARDIAWTADQQRIAFVSHGIVAVTDMATGETRYLTDGWEPTWSPDGQWIAFMTFRDGNAEIYTMDAYGHHLRRLTHNTASDSSPVWRP